MVVVHSVTLQAKAHEVAILAIPKQSCALVFTEGSLFSEVRSCFSSSARASFSRREIFALRRKATACYNGAFKAFPQRVSLSTGLA